MDTIAFLGLGQMGTPMARRLLEAGHQVTVWDRNPAHRQALVEEGARATASPAEAARGADVAITMLANPAVVEEVFHGADGLAAGLQPGQVLIEMSTIGPDALRSLALRLPAGVTIVGAPVRGSVPEAMQGTLQIFVGATSEDLERVRPVLEELGTVLHAGGLEAGASMKLVVNLALGLSIVALGEALAVGASLGLQQVPMLDVLELSAIGPEVRAKRALVAAGSYPPSFKLSLLDKDFRLVTETARARGVELKAAAAAMAWFEEGMTSGAGDLDFSAVVATIAGQKPSS